MVEQPWRWPLDGARTVVEPFRAPAHAYGAGHRGVDLAGSAPPVRAPAAGVVAFRGVVVDRPVLTIEHADGLVSTFEPLDSTLQIGDAVEVGDELGTIARGGHTAPGLLHLGVRLDGVYINPLLLFGTVERAVLLPCCEPL
jgi:murein DD-endopeptidase MepM/ murein hydrolase activator NlpD